MNEEPGRLQCHYCGASEVARMYLASVRYDTCECQECGARWDEDSTTGQFKGRASRQSILSRQKR